MIDIASCVGVSIVTVSKALSGKDGVSEELRAKIKEVAKEMGYMGPHAIKPSKAHSIRGTGNIGVLIPKRFLGINQSFYWAMYEMVVANLLPNNYYAILEVLQAEDEEVKTMPHMVIDGKTDGMIVMGQLDKEYHEFLKSYSPVPIMFLDSYDSTGKDSVISDGYYGMYAMTDYLISIGHREIFFVGTIGATSSITDRYFGFCRALSQHGIEVSGEMIVPDRDFKGKMEISLPDRLPTAFACNCDIAAYELMVLLWEKGLKVPEDISIVGFDNYMLDVKTVPEITTYSVDMAGMAECCVERMLRKINKNGYTSNMQVISGSILIKGSVLPIKG
jgi:DNA-binding LacI/PurR family transcriptional regulator